MIVLAAEAVTMGQLIAVISLVFHGVHSRSCGRALVTPTLRYVLAMARRCGHCGREGRLERKGDVTYARTTGTVRTGPYEDEVDVSEVAQIERCDGCGGLVLSTYTWVDNFSEPGDVADPEIIFPKQRSVADLPRRVRERYSKMLMIQSEPDAFAMRAGKLLEAICADQGISHGRLNDRLEELVQRGDVPKPLIDQVHLVREYRNIGSHDDVIDVEDEDVPLIRGFVDTLLGFLYWGPRGLERATAALQDRRNKVKRHERE